MADELAGIISAAASDQETPYVMVGESAQSRVEFLCPKPESIKLADIALGLAKTCRYAGAIYDWYSTAEHCLIGASLASSDRVRKQFLLHDAAEYVFGDMPSPVKRLPGMETYRKAEKVFESHIFLKYLGYLDLDEEVKIIDSRMCATEQFMMRNRPTQKLWCQPYPNVVFHQYSWRTAYALFLKALQNAFPGED